jgi:hypothetical protein
LKTPIKNAKAVEKLEFILREESPGTPDFDVTEDALDPEQAELEELRKQFVGDVDITEGSCRSSSPLRRASDECSA